MSCPWFYSKNGSDYVAVGITVTGNNKLFRVVSLQNLDSFAETLARTYTQSIQAKSTVKRVGLNRNWLLTGLFPSNRAVQTQLSVSLKKIWGSKICATVQLACIPSLCKEFILMCLNTLTFMFFYILQKWGNVCRGKKPPKISMNVLLIRYIFWSL